MNLRIKRMISWESISFLITTQLTYVFVENWFQTMFIATTSVLLKIFNIAHLEKKEIVQLSHSSRINPEEMIQK